MSSLYQNKILKQTSKDQTGISQKISSTFSSKNERFNYRPDRSPGPGQYQFTTSNYKLPEYHVQKNNQKLSPIKKEYQWILGSGRGSYLEKLNSSNYALGPGSYNLSMQLSVGGTNTNWGKSQRFQKKDAHSTQSLPGPGSYENKTAVNKGGFSVFKSKSPRTFIQKLISEASAPDIRKPPIQQLINNPENTVNSKEKENTKVSKPIKSSVFASKNPRFSEAKGINQKVGPGTYEIEVLTKSRSKEKLPKISIVKDQQRKIKSTKEEILVPGPCSYELNSKTIQKSLQQIGSIVIPSEPRFAQKYKKSSGPGPGAYLMRNKNQYEQELIKKLKSKYSPEKPSFNSSSSRIAPELPNKDNPLCNYNLQYYDLQYRVKKSQQHLEKLKIMQVTLPAFNSKAKR